MDLVSIGSIAHLVDIMNIGCVVNLANLVTPHTKSLLGYTERGANILCSLLLTYYSV